MPLPTWLAQFNRGAINRVTRPLARWLPGFGVVIHRGRRSGRVYRTTVNVLRTADGDAIALTGGPEPSGRRTSWRRAAVKQRRAARYGGWCSHGHRGPASVTGTH